MVTNTIKLQLNNIQLSKENFLISFESLRLPRAINRMKKKVSKLDFDAK
jgi:hypothetical protein